MRSGIRKEIGDSWARGAQFSFFRLVTRRFPGSETACEVVEPREIEVAHFVARPRAATAGGAVHQVSLVLVELGNLLLKIRRVHVDVDGARNMARLKLFSGAHVQHDVLFVRAEFFEFRHAEVFEQLFLLCDGFLLVFQVRSARPVGEAKTHERSQDRDDSKAWLHRYDFSLFDICNESECYSDTPNRRAWRQF